MNIFDFDEERLKELTKTYAIGGATVYFGVILYLFIIGELFPYTDAIAAFLGIVIEPSPFDFIKQGFCALAIVQSGAVIFATFMFFVCYAHCIIEKNRTHHIKRIK